jgi:hypothetical protein
LKQIANRAQKRPLTSNGLYDDVSQEIELFVTTGLKTLNPTFLLVISYTISILNNIPNETTVRDSGDGIIIIIIIPPQGKIMT